MQVTFLFIYLFMREKGKLVKKAIKKVLTQTIHILKKFADDCFANEE